MIVPAGGGDVGGSARAVPIVKATVAKLAPTAKISLLFRIAAILLSAGMHGLLSGHTPATANQWLANHAVTAVLQKAGRAVTGS
jgi:hypothetical protein